MNPTLFSFLRLIRPKSINYRADILKGFQLLSCFHSVSHRATPGAGKKERKLSFLSPRLSSFSIFIRVLLLHYYFVLMLFCVQDPRAATPGVLFSFSGWCHFLLSLLLSLISDKALCWRFSFSFFFLPARARMNTKKGAIIKSRNTGQKNVYPLL